MARKRKRKSRKKGFQLELGPLIAAGAVGYMALVRKPDQAYTNSPLQVITTGTGAAPDIASRVQLAGAVVGQNVKETWGQMLLAGVGIPMGVSILKKAVGTRNLPGVRIPGAISIRP